MPIPNLLHPVKITFELLNRTDTIWDETAREPVRQVIRTGSNPNTGSQVIIKGQHSYYFSSAGIDRPVYNRGGVEEDSLGYVTLRFIDMKKKGLLTLDADGNFQEMILKRGDRIVRLGKRTVNYFVTWFEDFAHYPNYGQTMIQVNFSDRHPSAQTGNL